jgi:hypothetical protein
MLGSELRAWIVDVNEKGLSRLVGQAEEVPSIANAAEALMDRA